MGNLTKADKAAIRKNPWCDNPGIPDYLQKHYQIQIRRGSGGWIDKYGPLNKAEADMYWKGQCAHNGWQARLLWRHEEIDRKGES